MKAWRWISLFILLSCQKNFSDGECEDLAMKSFKGVPQAAHDYEHHCEKRKLKITPQICKKVLNQFIMNGKIKSISQRYGERAVNCLSQNDLEKFNRN